MSKPNGAGRTAQTHFERVPLEVVKEIAEIDPPTDDKAGLDRPIVDGHSGKKKTATLVPARAPARKGR